MAAAYLLSCVCCTSVNATLISSFSFNNYSSGDTLNIPQFDSDTKKSDGSPTALMFHSFADDMTVATGTTLNATPAYPNAGSAAQVRLGASGRNNNGAITFKLSTTGYTNVTFSFAASGLTTNTFTTSKVQYAKLNTATATPTENSYLDLGSSNVITPNSGSFATYSFAPDVANALDNLSYLYVRILFNVNNVSKTTFETFDNFQFNGTTPTPEIGSGLLFASAASTLFLRRRRNV